MFSQILSQQFSDPESRAANQGVLIAVTIFGVAIGTSPLILAVPRYVSTDIDRSYSILSIPLRRLCEPGRNLRPRILITSR